jgi:uncharacterized protein YecT (DUF1311 family)
MKKQFMFVAMVLCLVSYPLAVASGSVSQDPPLHRIDKALEACIDKNGSTAGMVECTDKAYAAWDKELNHTYNQLMGVLKPNQKEALRLAQLEWLKYRDLDFKLIDSVYDAMQGTMYIPMRVDARMEVVKKRALELKGYLDLIQEGEE